MSVTHWRGSIRSSTVPLYASRKCLGSTYCISGAIFWWRNKFENNEPRRRSWNNFHSRKWKKYEKYNIVWKSGMWWAEHRREEISWAWWCTSIDSLQQENQGQSGLQGESLFHTYFLWIETLPPRGRRGGIHKSREANKIYIAHKITRVTMTHWKLV